MEVSFASLVRSMRRGLIDECCVVIPTVSSRVVVWFGWRLELLLELTFRLWKVMRPASQLVLLATDGVASLIGRRRGRSQSGEYTHVCVAFFVEDEVVDCIILSFFSSVALTELDCVGLGGSALL